MGWWWRSTPANSDQQTSTGTSTTPTTAASPSGTTQPPPTTTREEQADAELTNFLASLHADISKSTHPSSSPHPSSSSSETSQPESSSNSETPLPLSIAPDSLYPDTLSCRSAFDYAFFCQSFGGQFVNVYRYGELRSCSEHWENFWLCMKARALPEGQSKAMIRDHYRKKAIKYKTGPSSEDVWELRTEPVRGAFAGDFEALEREMKIEEAREEMEREMERERMKMQEMERRLRGVSAASAS